MTTCDDPHKTDRKQLRWVATLRTSNRILPIHENATVRNLRVSQRAPDDWRSCVILDAKRTLQKSTHRESKATNQGRASAEANMIHKRLSQEEHVASHNTATARQNNSKHMSSLNKQPVQQGALAAEDRAYAEYFMFHASCFILRASCFMLHA